MRRFSVALVAVVALALPAPAVAHTLSISTARGETFRWARMMATATEAYAWGVGTCVRVNAHAVDCPWWSKTAGRNGGATTHCDNVVRVRLGTFGVERHYPVVRCRVEGLVPT